MRVSNRIGNVSYAIRDVLVYANKLKSQGYDILQFNIGDPLKFDYEVPKIIQEALIKYRGDGYYSDSVGELSVRQKISKFESEKLRFILDPDDVIYFQGVSEGILFTFLSFLNPGDRVLVPGPTYPAYHSMGVAVQAEVVAYRCIEDEGWIPDIEDIRAKITTKTKLLVLINPNNPTGSVYTEKILKSIRDVVGETNTAILSDEIYDQLVIDEKYTSFSSIAKEVPTVVLNGFSKIFLAPGYRAAYGYIIDKQEKIQNPWDGVKKLCRVRLSSSTPISKAVVEGLSLDSPHLKGLLNKIRVRRDIVSKRLNEIDRITTSIPSAAFYIFPRINLKGTKWKNDKEFVIDLLNNKKVLVVHGSGFGEEFGKDHFRFVYLAPPDILNKGLDLIDEFLK